MGEVGFTSLRPAFTGGDLRAFISKCGPVASVNEVHVRRFRGRTRYPQRREFGREHILALIPVCQQSAVGVRRMAFPSSRAMGQPLDAV